MGMGREDSDRPVDDEDEKRGAIWEWVVTKRPMHSALYPSCRRYYLAPPSIN